MKEEIKDLVKNLKDQSADVKVDEDQINLINKIFDKQYEKFERKTYIESEIDKFLEKYEDTDINISYGDKGDKINLIQKKLLNHLKNYVINLLILTNLMKSIINLWIIL